LKSLLLEVALEDQFHGQAIRQPDRLHPVKANREWDTRD
jgi:hypothetical protein